MKITISPAQAILLLVDHYKDEPDKVNRLKSLYLTGAENEQGQDEIRSLFSDKILDEYTISYDKKTINEDASRRYFETHLAHQTIINNISELDMATLSEHEKGLEELNWMLMNNIDYILEGNFYGDDDLGCKEFGNLISKIKNEDYFKELTPVDRAKVIFLAQSAFLGVTSAVANELPLEIYGKGVFSDESRGKSLLEEQGETRSGNLGMMKSYMPVAPGDIARSETETPFLRPADQAIYQEGAEWVEDNFKRLVHPFSNSLSGTMLAQLRNLEKLKIDGKESFTQSAEQMNQFCRLFSAVLLYGSGGHGLHEFTAPLNVPEVQENFSYIPGFDKIDLKSMYHTGNEAAFDSALQKAIDYNKRTLQQAHIKNELKEHVASMNTSSSAFNQTEFKLAKDHMVNRISAAKEIFDNKIKGEFFSSYRAGHQQNILIQDNLTKIKEALEENNLQLAKSTIISLKNDLETKFGKNNLWGLGKKNEAYQIAESLEKGINDLISRSAQQTQDTNPPNPEESCYIRPS